MNTDFLFSNHSVCKDNPVNEQDVALIVKGIDSFSRLTNTTCIIVNFDERKIIYNSQKRLYVDGASRDDMQRKCENPYWALATDLTISHLAEIWRHYPVGGHLIPTCEFDTHICIIDYSIVLHGKEFYVNQQFTPLMMRQDGITKIGLFIFTPSTSKEIRCAIITSSGLRFRYSFQKNQFVEYDLTLSQIEKSILHCVLRGMKIEEIADKLYMSVSTVKTHRRRIFKKLDVETMNEALTVAQNYHLI